jgi:hypothetical protein
MNLRLEALILKLTSLVRNELNYNNVKTVKTRYNGLTAPE